MRTLFNYLLSILLIFSFFSCQDSSIEEDPYSTLTEEELSSTKLTTSSTIFGSYHFKHTNYGSRRSNDFLLGDINGDGRADLVKIGNDGAVSIALGNSSGRFNGYHYKHSNYGSRNNNDFLLGDINGDGRADLVKIGKDGVTHIALGNFSGRFSSYVHRITRLAKKGNSDYSLTDVDGNGRADLVKNDGIGYVTVSFGQASGSIIPNIYGQNGYGSSDRNDFLLGDTNKDGRADLVKIGNDGTASIAYGLSNPSFGSYFGPYVHKLRNYGDRRSNDFLLGDINRDGRADLVKIGNDGVVSVSLAQSSGSFSGGYPYKHNNYGKRGDNDFLLGDINGDNKADLVKIGNDGAVSIALAK
ncbi:VCBS repeat-containing protein [Muricauda sp. SCSIO 64092]|uniref:FG-GAP repeat domain-containing protein n=1 Tax=Allomuricauda sp. SCSIO 64092 TaxID=2908842 RepID=UPI001FF629D8|nr:VCBS repeat-containing protein [Muricauda sp. SCSIO 64092]UOY04702.1 VCBS repeat-containing protein [Muricauda sp. SCSIO 64092]